MAFMKYAEMTLEDKKRYIRDYGGLTESCGYDCSNCPISAVNQGSGYSCMEFMRILKTGVQTEDAVDDIIGKDYVFTPENTTLEYMIAHNTLEAIATYLETNNAEICGAHGCSDCPINQRNFSPEWNCTGCVEVRRALSAAANYHRRIQSASPISKCGKCKTCGHKEIRGEYTYCNAWGNFTIDDMFCGYYLDK